MSESDNTTESFTPWEAIAIYGAILFISLISLACIAVGAGVIYQYFFN